MHYFERKRNKNIKKDVPLSQYEDNKVHIDIRNMLGTCNHD